MSLNEAGSLDKSFGTDGVVSITIPGLKFPKIATVVNKGKGPKRKIYCAGWGENETINLYFLTRLNADGAPDTSFGDNGSVVGRFPETDLSRVLSLAVQDDGKVVLLGSTHPAQTFNQPVLARYNDDGARDATFGKNGYVVLDIQIAPPAKVKRPAKKKKIRQPKRSQEYLEPIRVEVLPNGKILLLQDYYFSGIRGIGLIIRLNKEGALDLQFNQIGYIPVMHPDYIWGRTLLKSILVQPDGKYMACGMVWSETSPTYSMLARYKSTGELDSAFGEGGFVLLPIGDDAIEHESIEPFDCMVQQPNQRILGVGNTSHFRGVLFSVEPNGKPNIQFNRGKPLFTRLEPDLDCRWTGAAVQNNGRVVVVGVGGTLKNLPERNTYEIIVARFNNNAQLDREFNAGKGWVQLRSGDGLQYATGVALQDDGKILTSAITSDDAGMLLRFHA